jgi:hypothetical protein
MRSAERIKPPKESRRGAREAEGDFEDDLKNTHYSQKTGHASRSEANDDRKISPRRR